MSETETLLQQQDIQPPPFDIKVIKAQADKLFRMAWPVSLGYFLQMTLSLTSIFFLGHMGTKQLAASALASMFANVTGHSLGVGMATALDTLCSQAHTGSSDPHALGKHTRRGFLVMLLLSIPIFVIWAFTREILVFLGQEQELSEMAATFIRYLMPGLIPYCIAECLKKYLQAQGIMSAYLHVVMILCPVNILLQYMLVWNKATAIGFIGAPLATSFTYFLMMVLTWMYIRFIDGYQSWGTWSSSDFNLKLIVEFLRLGVPGIAMVCSEWWAFEILALAAGLCGDTMLAAQTVIFNTCSLTFMIPLGISIAASTLIGNALGAFQPNLARLATITALILGMAVASFNCLLLFLCRKKWGNLWNNDQHVIDMIASVLPLASIFQLSDAMGCIGSGILRGLGAQKYGAYINISAYYLLGLPLGLLLTFPPQFTGWKSMGLFGLWNGLTVASLLVFSTQSYLIFRMNWKEQARIAKMRNTEAPDF